jgi:hypothetical protein
MKFDLTGDNKPKHVASSDTDSLFIILGPILQKLYPDLDMQDTQKVLPKIRPLQKEIGKKLNSYQSVLAKKLLNSDEHYFDLKPEFIIKKAYWSGKRRYAQHIVDQEGIEKNDIIMMGLDIMKSNFPPYFRKFGEELIKSILLGKDKKEIDEFILNFKKSLNKTSWRILLKPTGLKKMKEYIASSPKAGEIFSTLEKKCPINTKSAIIYNDILKFKKLDKEYPIFQIGDKMYIAYLKPNQYGINVIGFNGYNDPPEIIELIETYIDREGLFNSIIKNKLETIYSDLKWGSLVLNQNVAKFFSF